MQDIQPGLRAHKTNVKAMPIHVVQDAEEVVGALKNVSKESVVRQTGGTTTTLTVFDMNVEELMLILGCVLFLYWYLGVLRTRQMHLRSNPRAESSAFMVRRKGLSSGLTPEEIEMKLSSFSIQDYKPLADDVSAGGEIELEKRSEGCIVCFGQDVCAICLDNYSEKARGRLRRLHCDHVFHQGMFYKTAET